MKIQKTQEGDIDLIIPNQNKYGEPEEAPVFYNPIMEKDRDLSAEVIYKFLKEMEEDKEPKILDALSATGVRGIRYSEKTGAKSIANDANPKAVQIIKKNIELNEDRDIEVEPREEDANRIMTGREKFEVVDIDPFGSPAPFLNNAFKSLNPRKSLLAVTATDLGALSGHYPKTCFRRYGIKTIENPWEHEIGLRNLITAVQKQGSIHRFTADPLLCYWRRHYYRGFFEVRESKSGINRNFEKTGYIGYCENCGERRKAKLFNKLNTKCSCGAELKVIGPTWIGYLGNDEFLEKIEFPDPLLSKIKRESAVKELHYDTHRLSRIKGGKARKKSHYIDELSKKGYKASETMFTGHGFRTNAPRKEVVELSK